MQVKTVDGAMVQISMAQCQRAHKTMAGKAGTAAAATADPTVEQSHAQFHPHKALHAAEQYKNKASHNIKRIAQLQNCPTTQDDVKHALCQVMLYGTHWQFVDAISEMAQFQAARVVQHALKHTKCSAN